MLMRRALLIFKQSLGMQHPSTQTVLDNYRILLQTSGKSEEEIKDILGKDGIQYEVDIGEKKEPSAGLRAVIEQLRSDPSKIEEIFEKLKQEDPALLKELLELIERQQQK